MFDPYTPPVGSAWDDLDLDRLLARAQRQDGRAWSQIVDRFQSLVYSIPRRQGLTREDAEDVFQTTFAALYQALPGLTTGKVLPKWLATTAARTTFRVLRSKGRTASLGDERTLEDLVEDEDRRADELSVQAEAADLVRRGILDLPDKCRNLLTLLYFEDEASYQQISESLGMPIGAIGPNRARCLERLKRFLVKHGFDGTDLPAPRTSRDSLYQDRG